MSKTCGKAFIDRSTGRALTCMRRVGHADVDDLGCSAIYHRTRCTVCNRPTPEPGGTLDLCPRHYRRKQRTGSTTLTQEQAPKGTGSRVSVRLTVSEREAVESHAARLGVPAASLYRRAVRELLGRLAKVRPGK